MKAIIIDDEKRARISLTYILQEYCPEVTVVAECENLPEGIKAIRKQQPDIVLLDIEMPGHSGLELLDFFDENEVNFSIIFTTAYNEYALKAFKFSAVDYLLKPIIPEELADAIQRVAKQKQRFENFRAFKENLQQETLTKIAVPSGNTLLFLETNKIMYIKGEGAYSEVFCNDSTKQLVSRNLKNFEDILCSDSRFLRIHKSYIVYFNFVTAFYKFVCGSIELENKTQIPVSPDKSQTILDQIQIIKR